MCCGLKLCCPCLQAAHRKADSRLNHIIKNKVGGAKMALELTLMLCGVPDSVQSRLRDAVMRPERRPARAPT